MIYKGVFRNVAQNFFKSAQAWCTGDFAAVGFTEDKISESQLIHKKRADLRMQAR